MISWVEHTQADSGFKASKAQGQAGMMTVGFREGWTQSVMLAAKTGLGSFKMRVFQYGHCARLFFRLSGCSFLREFVSLVLSLLVCLFLLVSFASLFARLCRIGNEPLSLVRTVFKCRLL
jgi:hypothetical protein